MEEIIRKPGGDTMKKKNSNPRLGFTLIELIVVIGILGILGAIALPKLSGVLERARTTADYATLRTLNSVTEVYKVSISGGQERFDNEENDQARMDLLSEAGFLENKTIKAQKKGASFAWGKDIQQWYYSGNEGKPIVELDKNNLETSAKQLMDSLKIYLENPQGDLPSVVSNAGAIKLGQHNFPVNEFWRGYFESVDGLEENKIDDLRVYFNYDTTNHKYTSEMLGVYIKVDGKRAICYLNGDTFQLDSNTASFDPYVKLVETINKIEYKKLVPPDSN